MPRPASDPRFVCLTTTESELLIAAIDVAGIDHVCEVASVRTRGAIWRAAARQPVLPLVATALVATADRVLGTRQRPVAVARAAND